MTGRCAKLNDGYSALLILVTSQVSIITDQQTRQIIMELDGEMSL